jgi:hypothetical protein
MKKIFVPVVAAILAVGLSASSSRGQPIEKGPFTTRQPSNDGGGAKAECPANYYISAFQAVKDNDQQRTIQIWCKPFHKVDVKPADPGEKGPYITKEPSSSGGGPKVNCLDDYYAWAFAICKDGDPSETRSIRLYCKPLPKVDVMPPNMQERLKVSGPEPASSGCAKRLESDDG